MSELSKLIQNHRAGLGISQSEVGKRAGVDKTTVWKLENGKPVRAESLRRVCIDGLGMEEDSFRYRRMLAAWTMEQGNASVDATLIRREQARKLRETDRETEMLLEVLVNLSVNERNDILQGLKDPKGRRVLMAVARELAKSDGAKS